MPEEVEQLNGFDPGWTKGMPERRRFFVMGNALVVGLVRRMGETLVATRKDPRRGLRAEIKRTRVPPLDEFAPATPRQRS